MKDINIQIQEAKKIPNRINPKKSIPKHHDYTSETKKRKRKERNLKSSKRALPTREHQFEWQQISYVKA